MHETYRILGQAHQAELEREADRRRLAAIAREGKAGRALPKINLRPWKQARVIPARLAGFLR